MPHRNFVVMGKTPSPGRLLEHPVDEPRFDVDLIRRRVSGELLYGADIPSGLAKRFVGTFYQAPKPGAPPYVEVGQKVDADTEVCLIEVMKLFTPVKAGVDGTVREICASDAQMVEYEQVLVIVEPDA